MQLLPPRLPYQKIQKKPLLVYRDTNKDDIIDLDPKTLQYGMQGCNIHHASEMKIVTEKVDKWSAGCQVFQNLKDHNMLMELCGKSETLYGNSFSYTLVLESDILPFV